MKYDVIIIGLGPAGITAAIYAKRSGLNVLCLEKNMPGGMLNYMSDIDNFPGEKNISGSDLAFKMFEHLRSLDIDYKIKAVERIILENNCKKVIVSDDEYYYTKRIIIATGRTPKLLGLPNEKELLGRGLSTCAICDGHLFKDQDVCVVGGGDSAISEATYLSNICNKVYLIHRRDEFRASEDLISVLKKKNNVIYLMNSQVTQLNEKDGHLDSIIINNTDEIKVSAMFTYIGFTPSTSFVDNLGILDEFGYVEVDSNLESKIKGIYAVGDITNKDNIYQVITSCGEGAIAAINVTRSLEKE
ncbi:MAG: NAD(P)/FAD-dependent oxidoreductase [Bacilli bacterium]